MRRDARGDSAERLTFTFTFNHMINRVLKLVTEAQGDDVPYGDFYVVATAIGSIMVTPEVAEYIERELDRRWRPEWIAFRDRVGSRIRVRSSQIRAITESTMEQRAGDRRLDRARRKEEEADEPPWERSD